MLSIEDRVAALEGTLGTLLTNLLEPALIGPYLTFGDGGKVQIGNAGIQIRTSQLESFLWAVQQFSTDPSTDATRTYLDTENEGGGDARMALNAETDNIAARVITTVSDDALNTQAEVSARVSPVSGLATSLTVLADTDDGTAYVQVSGAPLWLFDANNSGAGGAPATTLQNGMVWSRGDIGGELHAYISSTEEILATKSYAAPASADYLVGTSNGSLSGEIVVGTSPGGELGGTWASPTVDATHSGSAHVLLTSNSPAAVSTSAAVGTGTASAKDDHVHAHETAHINHDTTWAAKGDLIAGTANDTAQVLSVGTNGYVLKAASGETTGLQWAAQDVALVFIIDGGGSAITTGVKGYLEVPFGMTITGWTIVAKESGSIVVDVWKDTYANFPPTVADTIAGTEKPTLSSAQKNQDVSLSSWTTAITAGDVLGFNVDSITTCTQVTITIRGTRP